MFTRDSSSVFVLSLISPKRIFLCKVEVPHLLIPAEIWVGAGGREEGGGSLAKEGIQEEKDRPLLLLQALVVVSLVLGW